jgi:hypothetical protein
MTGSSFWEGFSTLNFAWDRPTDGTCIKEYQVRVCACVRACVCLHV